MSVETMMLLASLGLNVGTIGAIFNWSNRLENRLTKMETILAIMTKDKK